MQNFFFANTHLAWFWLPVRLYLGWGWLEAGWGKVQSPAWVGSDAGAALTSFAQGALTKTGGAHPDVQWWYAWFLERAVLPNAEVWSYLVAYGELLVGAALIVGFLVGFSALFGMFMNLNFMLAGTVSVNPIWFVIGLLLVLAWRIAGKIGLDYYALPLLHKKFRRRQM